MASLPPDEELRRQQQLAMGQPATAQPQTEGAPSGGAGVGVGQVAGGAAPQTGSGWTNLQDYLTGNAATAQQMGTQLAGHLGADAQQATRVLGEAPTQGETEDAWTTTAPRMSDTDKALARQTQGAFGSIGTDAGRAAVLKGYGQDATGLDAWLLGAGGMAPVQQTVAQWQDPVNRAVDYQPQDASLAKTKIQIDPGTKGVGVAAPAPAAPAGAKTGAGAWGEPTGPAPQTYTGAGTYGEPADGWVFRDGQWVKQRPML